MALSASTVWEVRTTGASTAGGGFVTGASGVDYSQQNAAQYALTGIASAGSGNTILSALAVADMVGNIAQVISGTNFTTGFYEITSVVVGVSITFSTNNAAGSICTGVGANGVINIGGALSTLNGPSVVAGHKVWVKATASYSISAAQTVFTGSGTVGAYIEYEGYTTTRGDGGQVTVQRTSNNNYTMMSGSGAYRIVRNFIADGNGGTTMTGFAPQGANCRIENCKAICTSSGFACTGGRAELRNCWATGATGTAGFNMTARSPVLIGCIASDNTVPGFILSVASTNDLMFCIRCIADTNTGGSSQGFRCTSSASVIFIGCVAYGNGSDGILYDTTTTPTAADAGMILNCIFEGNGGYGINANAANVPSFNSDYNAFTTTNTSGARNNLPVGSHDVSLSGSPFTNAAGQNFALNNTASAGAACRAVGFPGALLAGGTGFLDIGALQHQDAGGGGTTNIQIGISDVFVSNT